MAANSFDFNLFKSDMAKKKTPSQKPIVKSTPTATTPTATTGASANNSFDFDLLDKDKEAHDAPPVIAAGQKLTDFLSNDAQYKAKVGWNPATAGQFQVYENKKEITNALDAYGDVVRNAQNSIKPSDPNSALLNQQYGDQLNVVTDAIKETFTPMPRAKIVEPPAKVVQSTDPTSKQQWYDSTLKQWQLEDQLAGLERSKGSMAPDAYERKKKSYQDNLKQAEAEVTTYKLKYETEELIFQPVAEEWMILGTVEEPIDTTGAKEFYGQSVFDRLEQVEAALPGLQQSNPELYLKALEQQQHLLDVKDQYQESLRSTMRFNQTAPAMIMTIISGCGNAVDAIATFIDATLNKADEKYFKLMAGISDYEYALLPEFMKPIADSIANGVGDTFMGFININPDNVIKGGSPAGDIARAGARKFRQEAEIDSFLNPDVFMGTQTVPEIVQDYENQGFKVSETLQTGLEFGYLGGAMLPQIGVAYATAGLLGPYAATAAGSKIIALLSNTTVGLSAAGGKYKRVLEETNNSDTAYLSGVLSGTLEMMVNQLLQAHPGVKRLTDKLGVGIIPRINNRIATLFKGPNGMVALRGLQYAMDTLGEGAEEVVSTLIQPYLDRWVYDPDAKNATPEDLAQAFFAGCVMGTIFDGAEFIFSKEWATKQKMDLWDKVEQGRTQQKTGKIDAFTDEAGAIATSSQQAAEAAQQGQAVDTGIIVTGEQVQAGTLPGQNAEGSAPKVQGNQLAEGAVTQELSDVQLMDELDNADNGEEVANEHLDPDKLAGKAKREHARTMRAAIDNVMHELVIQPEHEFEVAQHLKDYENMIRNGATVEEARALIFDSLYEITGVPIETDDNIRKINEDLRGRRIEISDADKAGIPDFNTFRKKNFGYLKIANRADPKQATMFSGRGRGSSVDTLYAELNSQYGDNYFPLEITDPAEQLMRIAEITQRTKPQTVPLGEAYGVDVKPEARKSFDDLMDTYDKKIEYINQYVLENNGKREQGIAANKMPIETIKKLFFDQKHAKKAYDKVMRDTILTKADKDSVELIRKGKMTPDQIPEGENKTAILAVAEAGKALDKAKGPLSEYINAVRSAIHQKAEALTVNSGKWRDAKTGLKLNLNTPERNLRYIAGKDGEAIIRDVIKLIHDHEAQGKRFIRDTLQPVRDMKLSKVQSELVQLIGEGKLSQDDIANRKFTDEDIKKAQEAVPVFRELYNNLYDMVVEAYVNNGIEPPEFRRDYFPHFEPDDPMSKALKQLGMYIDFGNLPTSIAGLTETFRPNRKWWGAMLERKGHTTGYDALEGVQRYIQSAKDAIYHTGDIIQLRALEDAIRQHTTPEYIQEQIDIIRNDPETPENEKRALIDEKLKDVPSELPQFVTWIREYTNSLAGKKLLVDRNMEHTWGRAMFNISDWYARRIGSNAIGFNVSSAFTNWLAIAQGSAGIKTMNMLEGMKMTLAGIGTDDGFRDRSTFLTNRKSIKSLNPTALDRVVDAAFLPMEAIDSITTEALVRGKYYDGIQEGLSNEEAMAQADEYVAAAVGDRSKGSMPLAFSEKNIVTRTVMQFQLEAKNQFDFLIKDLPRYAKQNGAKWLASFLLKYFIGQWLYNDIHEKFFGYRPSGTDAIGTANTLYGHLTGVRMPNLIDLALGNPEQSNTAKIYDSAGEGIYTSLLDIGKDVPIVGQLLGGGRYPTTSFLPGYDDIKSGEALGKWAKNDLLTGLLSGVIPPTGGKAVKKAVTGLSDVIAGGRYIPSKDGEKLMYPVDQNISNYLQGFFGGRSALPESQKYYRMGETPLGAKATAQYKEAIAAGVDQKQAFDIYKGMGDIKADKTTDGEAITGSRRENMRNYLLGMDNLTGDQRNLIFKQSGYTGDINKAYDVTKISDPERIKYRKAELAGVSDVDAVRIYHEIGMVNSGGGKEAVEAYLLNEKYRPNQDLTDEQRQTIYNAAGYNGELFTQEQENAVYLKVQGNKDFWKLGETQRNQITTALKNYYADAPTYTEKAELETVQTLGISPEDWLVSTNYMASLDAQDGGKTVSGLKKKRIIHYVASLPLELGQKALMLYLYMGTDYKIDSNDIQGYSADDFRRLGAQYINSLKISKDEKIRIVEAAGYWIENGRIMWEAK